MSSERLPAAPSVDLPALTVRWEGLVVAMDATTLNTIVRKATRGVPEIADVLIEPENGALGLTIRIRKGISVALRAHLTDFRLKDGFLGFRVVDLTAFGFLPIPNWILRRIVDRQPPGRAFFYVDDRVVVVNLNTILPAELSVQVRDVVCENGEVRLVFGPSQYRLDRLIEEIGSDPFEGE